MSVSENIYDENLFATVRGTCTPVLHLPPARISQRDFTQSLFQICSQLPLWGWRPPRRPAPPWRPTTSTLLPSSQPPSPPAALHLTLLRQKLTTMELPQWAYVSDLAKLGMFQTGQTLKKVILRLCSQVKLARAPVNSLNLELLQVGKFWDGQCLLQTDAKRKYVCCNSWKLRRASGTPCRSWVRRWRRWRSPAPRLWSSHPLNQPSSPLDWTSCKWRHLFYTQVYLEWNWGMDDFTTESQGDVQTRHNAFSTVLVNVPGNWRHWPRR